MTEFLEGCTPENVIPDYVQNFAEASMYVMESVDNDFFEVLESAGFVDENGAFVDEGTEVVSEGVKEIADKFIGALKALWSKIQGWFAQVNEWFESQKKKVKEHIDAVIKKASDATIGKIDASMLDNVKADKKVGSYTKYNIDVNEIKKTYSAVSNAIGSIKLSAEAGENPRFELSINQDVLKEKLGGKSNKEISDNVKSIMVASTNKEATIADIKSDFAEIKDVVFGNNDKKTLSAAYTTAKKSIDNSIKKINELKTHGIKKTADQKFDNKGLAQAATFCKSANQALHAYHNAVVSIMRARFAQYAHIISVCVNAAIAANVKAKAGAAKDKVKSKVHKESVTLESLFEW